MHVCIYVCVCVCARTRVRVFLFSILAQLSLHVNKPKKVLRVIYYDEVA